MHIHVKNGHVIDPANQIDKTTDLFISNGEIAAIDHSPDGFVTEKIIDATGLVVCPGVVDLRAHCREPGLENKATIASETRAAVSAGITTLCCPPDTDPVVDTPAVATLIQRRAEEAGFARVLPLGALTQNLNGTHLSEMHALKTAGCVGVTNAMYPVANTLIMRRAMEYAATHDLTVFINPEDHALCNNGSANEGPVATRLGLPGIPEAAETVAVASCLALIEQIGIRAHFSLISCKRSAYMIARAQHDGLSVTADVCAHQLHLTENDILDFDSRCHVRPPLRTQRDLEGLRKAVGSGAISAICSDHQPHERDAKLAPFSVAAPGMSTLETLLPLTLHLYHNGHLSLNQAIASLTCNPSQILGLDTGTLTVGECADICIFDPDQHWIFHEKDIVSQGKNTPFVDWEFAGQVRYTLSAGKLVYERA
ncbi:MAG: dihydroorotase [Gammaproteobacteria bacterium]